MSACSRISTGSPIRMVSPGRGESGDQVDAEPCLAIPAPVFRQRGDRLLALRRGIRVNGGEHTPIAAFDRTEHHAADAQQPPPVLGPCGRAGDDDARPEPRHRQRAFACPRAGRDQLVELRQGALAGQQQRVGVGEGDTIAVAAVGRIWPAAGRVVEVDQPHRLAHHFAEPVVGRGAGWRGRQLVTRDVHRHQLIAKRDRHGQVRRGRPGQPDTIAVQAGSDQDQPRVLAHGDRATVSVHDHPPAITGQPPRLHAAGSQPLATAGFHRIAVQIAQCGHHAHGM